MTSRREFIQSTVAVAAVAASARVRATFARSAGGGEAAGPLFRVLYDRSSSAGVAFGAEATARGAPVGGFARDIAGVWMNEIEPRWKSRPATIAGLTPGGPLFCLEYLARDYAMRVVYRIEHTPLADGRVRHTVSGHPLLAAWADRLTEAGDAWAACAAALATYDRAATDLRPEASIALLDLAECSGRTPETLFSWMIAPAVRPSPGKIHPGAMDSGHGAESRS